MLIRDLFRSDRPLFSIELFPPKTEKGVENLKRKLREIQPYHPDFISVTYGAGGGTRHTTSEITAFIHQELGMEVMPHLTCVSHSRAEIAGLLDHHRAIGVDNIMALRGDPPQGETRFEPPPDGFRYAVELVREIRALDHFGIGAAGYPEGHPEAENYETDLRRQVEKVAAGADFVVSQFFLETRHFFRWRDDLRHAGVTVPIMAGILPVEDAEISAMARKSFEAQGMKIHTGATVKSLQKAAKHVTAVIDLGDGKTSNLTVDRVILAVGITGNVEDLGLDGTKVAVDHGHIVVDQWLQTGEPGVYAIGDVVGPPWLAHKASHEGVICIEKIAGLPDLHPLDTTNIPGCTYCMPQIASVGMTEQAAKDAGRKVKVGRFPYMGNGKAIALGETEGMIKTIFDAETGEMLGAHMVGAEVTELIQGYCVAKALETTESELMHTIFPHPTLSEMMHESVLDAYGRAIHF